MQRISFANHELDRYIAGNTFKTRITTRIINSDAQRENPRSSSWHNSAVLPNSIRLQSDFSQVL